jgi:hypothetical protein
MRGTIFVPCKPDVSILPPHTSFEISEVRRDGGFVYEYARGSKYLTPPYTHYDSSERIKIQCEFDYNLVMA